jgi:hypothetical protein
LSRNVLNMGLSYRCRGAWPRAALEQAFALGAVGPVLPIPEDLLGQNVIATLNAMVKRWRDRRLSKQAVYSLAPHINGQFFLALVQVLNRFQFLYLVHVYTPL